MNKTDEQKYQHRWYSLNNITNSVLIHKSSAETMENVAGFKKSVENVKK